MAAVVLCRTVSRLADSFEGHVRDFGCISGESAENFHKIGAIGEARLISQHQALAADSAAGFAALNRSFTMTVKVRSAFVREIAVDLTGSGKETASLAFV